MPIRGVLLDLGGVVFVGDEALPGAVDAVDRIRAAGIPVRGLTNTTRQPRRMLLEKLRGLGLAMEPDELFMPAIAARRYLERHRLIPHLLIHPALEEEFAGLAKAGEPGALVIGDAGTAFTYERLNAAFRVLESGAAFLALARNRSFRDADQRLSLDAGPFVAALEFAAGRLATVLGKPSADFFAAATDSLGCAPADAVMIGDDVEADVGGAQAVGIRGILVQSGKYEPGDEARIDPLPAAVMPDLAAAADWIASHNKT